MEDKELELLRQYFRNSINFIVKENEELKQRILEIQKKNKLKDELKKIKKYLPREYIIKLKNRIKRIRLRMLEILESKWVELSLEGKHQEADNVFRKIEEVKKINYLEDLDTELKKKIQWLVIKGRNTDTTDSDTAQRIFSYVEKYTKLKERV